MKRNIYFITGVSGSGKTTLVKPLQERLQNYEVHDFDEVGVPADVDEEWRRDTTFYWLNKANKSNKPFIILGTTVPAEVLTYKNQFNFSYYFGFLNINQEDIYERLSERKWANEEIQNHIKWNPILRKNVEDTQDSFIITVSGKSVEQITEDILQEIQ